MYALSNPLSSYIKLFIMHFLCIYAVQPCHIQEVISQHLFELPTKFFQYSNAHDLLSDHRLCQVAPKLKSRSLIIARCAKVVHVNIPPKARCAKISTFTVYTAHWSGCNVPCMFS